MHWGWRWRRGNAPLARRYWRIAVRHVATLFFVPTVVQHRMGCVIGRGEEYSVLSIGLRKEFRVMPMQSQTAGQISAQDARAGQCAAAASYEAANRGAVS